MSLVGPSGNTGVFIAPNEALYLYAKTGNLILQSSNVFVSGISSGAVVATGAGGRLFASGTTATELGHLSGVTSSVQAQIDSKVNSSGHPTSRVVVTNGSGIVSTSTVTTTELGYLSGLTGSIQSQLNNVQSTLVLSPNIVPMTNASGNVVSSAITSTELTYLSGVRSSIQNQIDAKQNTITFPSGINRAVVTNASGNVTTSSITTTELDFLSGVTSGIQGQINTKLNASGFAMDRVLVTNGSGSVVTSTIPTANLTALDSLRSIASNVSGNLFVNGRVGILKSNPDVALDVSGNIAASAAVIQGGLTTASATVQGALTASSTVVQGGLSASTVTVSSLIVPSAHNAVDIGSSGTRFRDLYVQGTIYAPSIVSTTSAASNVLVTDTSALATPQYLVHVPGTTGEQPPRITSSRLWFIPSTGNVHATNFVGNLSGIASNASRWTNARTLTLTGDVAGSVSIDGTGDVSMATTIQQNSVALGTDTTGNYVATVAAGSGGISVTGSGAESAAVTIGTNATDQNTGSTIVMRSTLGDFSARTITANLTGIASNASRWTTARTITLSGPVTGAVSIDGTNNVTINTSLSSTAVALGTNTTGNYVSTMSGSNGISTTFTGSSVVVSSNASSSNTPGAIVSRDASGNFSAGTITASLNGVASNASRWTTARTLALTGDVVGSVSIDGTGNVSMATTIQQNSVALGTDTTGNYVATVAAGSGGISVTGSGAESAAVTIGTNATDQNTGSTIVMRDTLGNFNAGTITASLNGNATTATRLQTTRFINGQPFDGTGNVTIPATVMSTLSPGTYISGSAYDGTVARTWTLNASTGATGSTVVVRDTNGDFSARTITANLSGEATVATRVKNLLRPGTGFASGTSNYDGQADVTWNIGTLGTDNFPTLVGLTAGSYGGSTTSASVTVDNKGRVTGASNVTITPAWDSVTGKPTTFTPSSHTHAATDITSGTFSVARGGTGRATLSTNKVLVGNGTSGILQPTNLHWDNSNSRLGIGTDAPFTRLQVGNLPLSNSIYDTSALSVWHPTAVSTTVLNDPVSILYIGRHGTLNQSYTTGASFAICRWENSGDASRARMDIRLSHGQWSTGDANLTTVMSMRSDGRIGIGTTNPSYLLHVSGGDIACSADIIAFASDERLKTNVRTIENALDKIHKISGVQFDWIPEVHGLGFHPPRMSNEVGLLAQQVQKVVPQAVMPAPFDREGDRSKSGHDYLTVKYDKLVPLLLEGIKELRRENLELRREIEDIKNAQKNRT